MKRPSQTATSVYIIVRWFTSSVLHATGLLCKSACALGWFWSSASGGWRHDWRPISPPYLKHHHAGFLSHNPSLSPTCSGRSSCSYTDINIGSSCQQAIPVFCSASSCYKAIVNGQLALYAQSCLCFLGTTMQVARLLALVHDALHEVGMDHASQVGQHRSETHFFADNEMHTGMFGKSICYRAIRKCSDWPLSYRASGCVRCTGL